jgi:hypothetical protein
VAILAEAYGVATPEPANAAAPESGAVSYLSVVGDEEVLARPEVGLLTVWLAHVRHRVLPYRGTTERPESIFFWSTRVPFLLERANLGGYEYPALL